ncbi:sugar phosphate isomerase/epimerase family protein [Rhizobium sp.]
MTDLPIIGAALALGDLPAHRDWLFEKQRDLELLDFFGLDPFDTDMRPLIEQARAALSGYTGRLGIHGPWAFQLDCYDAEIRLVIKRRLKDALKVCEAIGATQMVVHSPYMFWHHTNLGKTEGEGAALVERVHLCLAEAVKFAEEIGCTIVIENIEDTDPNLRVALADSFGSPSVAVSLDTGHAHFMHARADAPAVDYFVRTAGNRLEHLHLQDVDGYADRHWPIGEGTIAWPALFRALRKLDTNPRLILEIHDKSRIAASVAYLSALGLAQ